MKRVSFILSLCCCICSSCKKEVRVSDVLEIKSTISINKDSIPTAVEQDVPTDDIEEKDDRADIFFISGWTEIEDKILTETEFQNKQIDKINRFPAYDDATFSMRTFKNKEDQTLSVVKGDWESEVVQYLLAYKNDTLNNSLMVSYEDFVEYYSSTTTTITGNEIELKTMDWTDDANGGRIDTTIERYRITPDLSFEIIQENE